MSDEGRPVRAKWKLNYLPEREEWGRFKFWGADFHEFESGPANFSTAVIELPSGEIVSPPVDCVRFMDRSPGDREEWQKMTGGRM